MDKRHRFQTMRGFEPNEAGSNPLTALLNRVYSNQSLLDHFLSNRNRICSMWMKISTPGKHGLNYLLVQMLALISPPDLALIVLTTDSVCSLKALSSC